MAKKFEHIDIFTTLISNFNSNNQVSIYKHTDEWVIYNPFTHNNMRAETLSKLNLQIKDFLDEFVYDLYNKGYGHSIKKKKEQKK